MKIIIPLKIILKMPITAIFLLLEKIRPTIEREYIYFIENKVKVKVLLGYIPN